VVRVAVGKSQGLLNTFKALFPQYAEKIMTVARQLERKGKREGEQKKAIEVAQRMLSKNYPIEEITGLTNLLKEEISLLGK
jgi:predicted transposase/invertase (TIGR01784 family)